MIKKKKFIEKLYLLKSILIILKGQSSTLATFGVKTKICGKKTSTQFSEQINSYRSAMCIELLTF